MTHTLDKHCGSAYLHCSYYLDLQHCQVADVVKCTGEIAKSFVRIRPRLCILVRIDQRQLDRGSHGR